MSESEKIFVEIMLNMGFAILATVSVAVLLYLVFVILSYLATAAQMVREAFSNAKQYEAFLKKHGEPHEQKPLIFLWVLKLKELIEFEARPFPDGSIFIFLLWKSLIFVMSIILLVNLTPLAILWIF
jgi:hypothetical protein